MSDYAVFLGDVAILIASSENGANRFTSAIIYIHTSDLRSPRDTGAFPHPFSHAAHLRASYDDGATSERAKATERARSTTACCAAPRRRARFERRRPSRRCRPEKADGSGAPEVALRGDSHAAARWAMAASDGAPRGARAAAVCVLDFASDSRPGGGWRGDQRGTQEEALCRVVARACARARDVPDPGAGAVVVPDGPCSRPRREKKGRLVRRDRGRALRGRRRRRVHRAQDRGRAALRGGVGHALVGGRGGAARNAADDGRAPSAPSRAPAPASDSSRCPSPRARRTGARPRGFPERARRELDAAAAAAVVTARSPPPATARVAAAARRARGESSGRGRRLFLESTEPPKPPSDGFAKYPKMAEGPAPASRRLRRRVARHRECPRQPCRVRRGAGRARRRRSRSPSARRARRARRLLLRARAARGRAAAAAPAVREAAAAAGRDELAGRSSSASSSAVTTRTPT